MKYLDCRKRNMWGYALVGLLLMLLLFSMVACQPSDKPTPDHPSDSEDTLSLYVDGKLTYTIIRSDTASNQVSSAASSLHLALSKVLNLDRKLISIKTDWEDDYDAARISAQKEILVGMTNRPESAQVKDSLSEDQYAVRVVGNKIVIIGCDDNHTEMAVRYFLKNYGGYDMSTGTFESRNSLDISAKLDDTMTEAYIPVVDSKDAAKLINTKYTTEDVVVADIVLQAPEYDVDPSGERDSTEAIKAALRDCSKLGGGTVFLPAGKYRVTESITIPAFVTLRGDWQDPDYGDEYGTIILAMPKSSTSEVTGLFLLGGSCGVIGLTVYYPEQSLTNVVPYSYTFYETGWSAGNGHMLATVKNCTIVNGYYGVGATTDSSTGHEQLTIANLKGTFLATGINIGYSSDVGTCTNITISPRYWTKFAKAMGYTAPSEKDVAAYTRGNTTAMKFSDVEWTQFTHVTISDCKYGVHIVPAKRIQFAGAFYDMVVRNCDIAVLADNMDNRWGSVFSNCYLEGSEYGMVNHSGAVIKMAGTTVIGGLKGDILVDTDDLSGYPIDTGKSYVKPASFLYVVNADKNGGSDISEALQKVLDAAGQTGGVVYLPAGNYRLDHPVNVPAGVELRGSSSVATREQAGRNGGTRLLTKYGVGMGEDERALITLAAGAGVNGLHICYDTNGSSIRETAYAIRGTGKDVYVVNTCIVSAGRGVDFSDCNNHFIKKLTSFCFINDIRAGGTDGTICEFLHNATVRMRIGFTTTYDEDPNYKDANYVARDTNTTIELLGAQNERVWSAFSYGVAHMISAINSTGTLVVNMGTDNIGDNTAQMVIFGGDYTGLNMMRYNGHSVDIENGARVKLYSRLAIWDKSEGNIK